MAKLHSPTYRNLNSRTEKELKERFYFKEYSVADEIKDLLNCIQNEARHIGLYVHRINKIIGGK